MNISPAKWIKDRKCDICSDNIGLYTPYYTVNVKGWLCRVDQKRSNPMVLCASCYRNYEGLITQMEIQQNHNKNYMDMKGETRK